MSGAELEQHRAIALAWRALCQLPKDRRGEALLALTTMHRKDAEPSPELIRDLNRQCGAKRRAAAAAHFPPAVAEAKEPVAQSSTEQAPGDGRPR